MMAFVAGEVVEIPCEVAPGAFPGESLVTIQTKTGTISGFVRTEEIHETNKGTHFLIGEIKEVNGDELLVMLHGSFFTTTGLAKFDRSRLKSLSAA